MSKIPNALMQQRRDTKARWTAINPILCVGQIGYEVDVQPWKSKVGDGFTRWNDLPYQQNLPGGGTVGQALIKASSVDGDFGWGYSIPAGGSLGMVLAKKTGSNFDVEWQSIWRTATFTTNGRFIIPARTIAITAAAPGGGGSAIGGMGGGGGEAVWRKIITGLTVGDYLDIVIGAPGLAGYCPGYYPSGNWPGSEIFSSYQCSGTDGGDTIIYNSAGQAIFTLKGGKGAKVTATTANPGLAGGIGGQRGGMPHPDAYNSKLRIGGDGGNCLLGNGGRGGVYAKSTVGTSLNGENGNGWGSGGAGASDFAGDGYYQCNQAGNGAPSGIIFEW